MTPWTATGGVTINNASGVTLNADKQINSTVTFTSGILTTTASYNLALGSAATLTGAGAGKYVYGTLRRFVPATANLANFIYQIGDASNYAPVSLTFTGTPAGSSSIDASTVQTAGAPDAASNISQSRYLKRSWKLTNNGVTGFSSYAPEFTFVAGDIIGNANTSAFSVGLLSAGSWSFPTIGTRTSTTTAVSGVTVTGFGDFYIGEQAAVIAKFAITGTATQTAGATQHITITALDNNDATATTYTGTKIVTFSGANASLSPVTLPSITDINGTAVAFGSPVSITFVAGVAQVSGTTNGVMKLHKAEVASISVTDGTISAAGANRLTVTVSAASANKLGFSTQPGSGVSNTNLSPQPQVSILDVYGNLVTSATNAVTLAIANNAGPGATLSVTTNPLNAVGGIASFSGVKLDKTGIGYTLLATASSLTSTTSSTFNISSGPATKLVITGVGTQTAGTTQSITITAQDASGNTTSSYDGDKELIFSGANASPGPVITAPASTDKSGTAKAFGTATVVTFVNGVAAVPLKLYKAETASITATDGTITADANRLSVTVSSATSTQLTFTTQPVNWVSLAALPTQPIVKVLDAYGNVATGSGSSVTLAIGNNANSGTLSVTTNPLTASSGVAAFSGVKINKVGSGYTLTASASGLTSATSNSFSIVAGAATIIQYQAGNGQNIPVSTAAKILPAVLVTDASGNPVAGVTVTFAVTSGGGAVTGATATTNANGIATVGSWTVGATAGTNNNILQATAAGLTGSPVSFTVSAVPQIVCPTFDKRNNGQGSGECYPGDVIGTTIPSGKVKSGVFAFKDGAANYGVTQVLLNGTLYQEGSTLYQGSIFFGGFNVGTSAKEICFYGNAQSDNATPAGHWKFNFTDAYGNNNYCDYVITSNGSIATLAAGSIAADQTICAGNAPAPLTSAADASGSTGITYQWQRSTSSSTSGYTNISGATSNTYSPAALSTTTYFIRIATDKSGLAVSTDAVTITVNPSPSKPVASVTQPSCSVSTGTITVVPSGNAGDTYSYDGVNYSNTTGVFSSMTPGTYPVTVKNSYGCVSAVTSVTVNAAPPKPAQPVISSSAAGSVCGGTGVTLTSTLIGTGKYQWYKSGTAIVGATSRTYTTYQSGSYTVTTTDVCTSDPSAASVVTITPLPTASITQNTQLSLGTDCSKTTLTLVANSDAVSPTYQWKKDGSDIPGAVNATYAAASAGTYTVAITNNGCTTVSPASVIASFPTAQAAGQTTVCQGESVTLQTNTSGLTNPTFQWQVSADGINNFSKASGTATASSYQAVSTGYYRVSVSYDGITQASCAIKITVNALPSVSVSSSATNLCSGSTATLTATAGGASPYTYHWTIYGTPISGATSSTYTTGLSASYAVQVTDNNGCRNTSASTVITVNDLPTVTGQLSVCGANATSQLTGSGIPAASGAWVSGNTSVATVNSTGLVTAVAPGTTTITYKDANGCSTSLTFVVESAPAAVVNSGNTSVCSGSNVVFNITGTSGAVVTYTLNDGLRETVVLTAGSAQITVPEASSNQKLSLISIQSSDGGCTQSLSSTATVTVNPLPVVGYISGVSNVCVGSTTQLFSASANGTASWTTSSPHVTLSAVGGTVTVTGISAGLATIYYSLTNEYNCTAQVPVDVTVNGLSAISVAPSATAICTGGSVTLTVSGADSYSWSPATGLSGITGTVVSATLTTTTAYTVSGTDINGCVNTGTVTVTVNALPSITVSADLTALCIGGTASLTASGADTYSWSPSTGLNTTTGATVQASPLTTTAYTITGTVSATGCVNTATLTLTINPLPTIAGVTGNLTICSGLTTTLTASSGATSPTYKWYTAASGGTLLYTGAAYTTAALNSTTHFYVDVTSEAGCVAASRTEVTVTVNPTPTISGVTGTLTICSGLTTTLTASSGAASPTYHWYTAASGGSLLYTGAVYTTNALTTTTSFYVDVTSDAACVSVSRTAVTVTVNVLPEITGTVTSLCASTTTDFTASGTAALSSPWRSSDISIATVSAGKVTAISAGNVTITYTDINGCEASRNLEVLALPATSLITVSPLSETVCTTTPITYSMPASAYPNPYDWEAPANSTGYVVQSGVVSANTRELTLLWPTTGTKTLYLRYKGDNGCWSPVKTVSKIVELTPTASVAASTASICSGSNAGFVITGSNGAVVTYQLTGISGTVTSTLAGGSSTITVTGAVASQTITLVSVSLNSCTETLSSTATVIVNKVPDQPSAIVGDITVCAQASETYTVIDERSNGKDVTSWTWQLPAGWTGSSTDHTINVVASSVAGSGTITVTANNACGASIPRTIDVTVLSSGQLLSPSFTINSVEQCLSVNAFIFTNTTSGAADSYLWDFKDGSGTTTTKDATHQYSSVGNYDVTLTVSGGGCSSTISQNVVVTPLPTATVTADNLSVCSGENAIFNITGTVGSVVTYKINGGADQQVSLVAGSAQISITGAVASQSISLVSVANSVCTEVLTGTATVTVNSRPVITLTGSVAQICADGDRDNSKQVTYTTESGMSNYTWTVLGGIQHTTISGGGTLSSTLTLNWEQAGSPTVTVIYTNAGGCRALTDAAVTTTVLPTATLGTVAQFTSVCSGTNATIQLTGLVPNASQTIYYDIQGSNYPGLLVTSDASGNASFTIPVTYGDNGKEFMVNAILLQSSGCEEEFTVNNSFLLQVKPLPVISGTLTAAYGTPITLTGDLSPAAVDPWVSANTSVANISDGGVVSMVSVGTATITYTSSNGCSISALLTINAAPLTITATDQSKLYGVTGNLGTSAFTVTGLAAGESINSVSLSSAGTAATASVGTYSITASAASGNFTPSNYTITYVPATLTVTTVSITITAYDQSKMYGTAGTLDASAFSVTGLVSGESISSVTLSSPGTLSTAAVGTYSITASNATGATISNYVVNYVPGTLTVTSAPLTITANDQTKVYGTTGTLGSSAFSVTGLAAGESISSVTLNSPGTLATAAVGTYSITASNATGTTVSNYTINYVTGTLTVTAAPLTITANDQSKVYGVTGNLGSIAFSVTGLVAGETISSVTLNSPGTLSTAAVGAYNITASNATGTTVSNYTINYVTGTLTVTAAPLTITANDQSKVYGVTGSLGSTAFSVTGLVSGESISSVVLSSPGTLSTAAVGTYGITAANATGAAVSNYTINYVTGTLTVTAAPLTITANDQTKVYGTTGILGSSAFSVTGLAAGERISAVTLSSPGVLSTAAVGAYSITASNATGTTVSN
ncbi:MAG: Ig-like domain-containing protein, partial [Bacteroidetes bacterium]|nr:Ig-like domain-containing protein [Bacteroidota bacterium]